MLADTCRSYRHPRRRCGCGTWCCASASPQIVTGARQALSIGIILMVISEMFAASNGLGFTIVQFQRGFQIPEMWSGVLLLGLIGVLLSLLFRLVERRVLAWYHGVRAAERDPLEGASMLDVRGLRKVYDGHGRQVEALARPHLHRRRRASSSAWSARPAAARPRCCAASAGLLTPTAGEVRVAGSR